MKQITFLLMTVMFVVGNSFVPPPVMDTSPNVSIKLSFISNDGTNGSAVAYNPKTKLYYAAIAGNASFPLEVFDEEGNNVYQMEAGVDLRGLWYNEDKDRLEGNKKGEEGFFYIKLDGNGYPMDGVYSLCTKADPPDYQSIAASDGKYAYYFYKDEITITEYMDECKVKKTLELKGFTLNKGNLNETSLIVTGDKKYMFGILDATANLVYMYNKKGKYMTKISLPSTAPADDWFKFSYANGHIFLYDVDRRAWKGYKVM